MFRQAQIACLSPVFKARIGYHVRDRSLAALATGLS